VDKDRECNLKACASYRKNHPDRRLEIKRNRRAAKLSSGTITTEQWELVKEAAGHCCVACHRALKLSMDHIIPLVKGGPHTIENIQPLCHSCNSRKNVKTHDYRTPEMKKALGISEED
jgi:5-methylcytosine-specific restriction endonuclease McrA